MRTANPVLSDKVWGRHIREEAGERTMTVGGTAFKAIIAIILLLLAASYTWKIFMSAPESAAVMPFMIGGLIGGLILAIVTCFKPQWAPYTTPIYAVAEGFFLGALSAMVQTAFPDVPIVVQAVFLTFAIFLVMMVLYATRVIKVTEKFRAGVIGATGAIFLVYMASWILGMFGVGIPYIHEGGLIGIGFSLFVIVIAALNLALDFDLIENGAKSGAPKWMEWFGAFGLLVTLVWLYIEVLRLLAKINSRR